MYFVIYLFTFLFSLSAISDEPSESIWVPKNVEIALIPVDIYAGKSKEELDLMKYRHWILSNPTEYNALNPISKTKEERDEEDYYVYIITHPIEHSLLLDDYLTEEQKIERNSFLYLITHPLDYKILLDKTPKDPDYYIRKSDSSLIFIE